MREKARRRLWSTGYVSAEPESTASSTSRTSDHVSEEVEVDALLDGVGVGEEDEEHDEIPVTKADFPPGLLRELRGLNLDPDSARDDDIGNDTDSTSNAKYKYRNLQANGGYAVIFFISTLLI